MNHESPMIPLPPPIESAQTMKKVRYNLAWYTDWIAYAMFSYYHSGQ